MRLLYFVIILSIPITSLAQANKGPVAEVCISFMSKSGNIVDGPFEVFRGHYEQVFRGEYIESVWIETHDSTYDIEIKAKFYGKLRILVTNDLEIFVGRKLIYGWYV